MISIDIQFDSIKDINIFKNEKDISVIDMFVGTIDNMLRREEEEGGLSCCRYRFRNYIFMCRCI